MTKNSAGQKYGWLVIILLTCWVTQITFATSSLDPEDLNQFFTQEELAWLKDHPVIKVAADPDYAPTEFYSDGHFQGITVDFFQVISQKYNLHFEYVLYDTWQGLISAAKRGDVHIISAIVNTSERAEYLNFTKPYLTMPTKFFIRKGRPNIGQLLQASQLKIATIKGYSTNDYLTLVAPNHQLVPVTDIQDGLSRLMRKEVDTFVGDSVQVQYYAHLLDFEDIEIDQSVDYNFSFNLSVGIKKEEAILHGIMSKIIDAESGATLNQIQSKWLDQGQAYDGDDDIDVKYLYFIVLFALIAVTSTIVVLLWNKTLKSKVASQTEQLSLELEKTRLYDQQLRLLIDSIPYPVFTKDADYRFVTVNKAYAHFFGLTVEEIEGEFDFNIYQKNANTSPSKFRGREEEVLKQQAETHLKDYELIDAQGQVHVYDIKKVPYPMLSATEWGLLGISVDITPLKKQEIERIRAQKQLVANVANQINTPLGNIISSMTYLSLAHNEFKQSWQGQINQNDPFSDAIKGFLEAVDDVSNVGVKGIQRIKSVVDTFESMAIHGSSSPITQVNLYDLLSILTSNKRTVYYFDYNLHFEPDTSILTAKPALEEVLSRIIDNAIEHGFNGGRYSAAQILKGNKLDFYLEDMGDKYKLEICDNGPGIPPEDFQKVLDPLYSTTLHTGSLGVGLSIASSIAQEVLGGKIQIDNTPGGGCKVVLTMLKNLENHV